MFQIIYVSLACEPFSQARLRQLLRHAREKNEGRGITGMLLYKNDSFMQALEGAEETVRALYNEICGDTRHEAVRLLMAQSIEERDFPDWSMGFENVTDLPDEAMPPGYANLSGDHFTSETFTEDPSFAHTALLGFKNRSFT